MSVVVVAVFVVVVISASCTGYGVRSFFAKLFSLRQVQLLRLFRALQTS